MEKDHQLLYHGTTYTRFCSIMENGFNRDPGNKVWTCSDSKFMYFHTRDRYSKNSIIKECAFQAMRAACTSDYQGTGLCILELSVPSIFIFDDTSVSARVSRIDQKSVQVDYLELKTDMIRNVYLNPLVYNPYLRWIYNCASYTNSSDPNYNLDCAYMEAMELLDCKLIDTAARREFMDDTIYNVKKYKRMKPEEAYCYFRLDGAKRWNTDQQKSYK